MGHSCCTGPEGPHRTHVLSCRYPSPAPVSQALPLHYGGLTASAAAHAAADADGSAPDVPPQPMGLGAPGASPEDKPLRLSPSKVPEPLREVPDEEPLVERGGEGRGGGHGRRACPAALPWASR